jgi:hypothetical protein
MSLKFQGPKSKVRGNPKSRTNQRKCLISRIWLRGFQNLRRILDSLPFCAASRVHGPREPTFRRDAKTDPRDAGATPEHRANQRKCLISRIWLRGFQNLRRILDSLPFCAASRVHGPREPTFRRDAKTDPRDAGATPDNSTDG